MKPYFEQKNDIDTSEQLISRNPEKILQNATQEQNKQNPQTQEEQIIQVPSNINAYKLSKLMNVEAGLMLKRLQHLSREIYSDEFQILSKDAIETLSLEFEKEIEFIEEEVNMDNMMMRPPVVTIMGHVDHGKTTLLDSFRHSSKVKEEFGDITQSIGAFTFVTDSNNEVTFIDTPGHEAFNNLRVRGAKVTDIIILVISAIESVQPQTVEVIEIAKSMRIPVIVAINKIDRPAADVESVLLDLSNHNLVPEQLGGDIICVPISAKMGTNLDQLEQKIIDVATNKLNLLEDFSVNAQCFIIESNFDEKTTQITATVLVKKGTLKQDDIFVCGTNEGKVRFMINDQGKTVKQAYPGQAVKLGGFRSFPDVGNPLYAVKNHDEAQFIVTTIKNRRENELAMNQVDHSKKAHDLKKQVKGLSRLEKRKIYSGDKTLLYEKLGLVEEQDLEGFRKKFGIKRGIDLAELKEEEVEKILLDSENLNKPRRMTGLKSAKKNLEKDTFRKLVQEIQGEKAKLQEMDEDERQQYTVEKQKLKEVFRAEDIKHFPIIIKASSAGTLETLLKEAEKIIQGMYRVNVIDYSVGPITEGDMTNAQQTGAILFGFDVPCSPIVNKSAESFGVCIKQHKTIYKFLEDVENYIMDVKQEIKEEGGSSANVEILGTALVSQIFKVKDTPDKKGKIKMLEIAGSNVTYGEFERKMKYRIVRNDKVLQENLKIHSMKRLQQDVTKVEKGLDCGVAFENFEGELRPGDVIECYKEVEHKVTKFNRRPGVFQSY